MAEIPLQEYCRQIEDMIAQGLYTEAVAHGKHILRQYPKYVAAYGLMGRAMLEAHQNEYAADMFRRVLSADPEDMPAWVVMSEVCDQRDELNAALWYLERAFELTTDNKLVGEQLGQLYGRRDGVQPQRVQLTRGALARLYLKGDLLPRAISEFHVLLAEHPERVDLAVALAEALWRNGQRLEASEVCQSVLDRLPYCLKANLILGEIWTGGGRGEGQMYLRRAKALDPENRMAQALFGDTSVLPAQEVRIAPLEYKPTTGEERPGWLDGVEAAPAEGPPLTEREATVFDIAAGLEAQIEIPAWLEEIDIEESAEPAPGEIPDWLEEGAPPEEAIGEETAEQVAGLDLEPVGEEIEDTGEEAEEGEGEVPGWLSELGAEPIGGEEPAVAPSEEGLPEWLSDVSAEATGGEAAPAAPSAEQSPDWLAGLRDQFTEESPAPEPIPLEEAAPTEMPEEAPTEGAEAVVMPAWLEGEGMPSGDEALSWLEQLAVGKEDELLAQVEAESEARVAEIMGRPKPVEEPVAEEPAPAVPEPVPAEIPDWVQKLAPPEAAIAEAAPPADLAEFPPAAEAALEEAVAPPPGEGAFGWTTFGEPEVPLEVAPPVEEPSPIEAELPEVPVVEQAPAPVAEEPAPAMPEPVPAEIPDWVQKLAPPEAAIAEAAPPADLGEFPPAAEAALEEAVAPPPGEGAFGWTTFGEPEAPPEVAPPVEKPSPIEAELPEVPVEAPAPVAEEAALPAWLEGEGMPSGDEALAWLEQLAAGKEDELLAQIEAETEARTAEIMGRPKPAEPPVEEVAPEEAAAPPPGEEIAVPPVEEAVAPTAEAAFGWTTFGEPEAPPEVVAAEEALPTEEPAPSEAPEWARLEEVEAPPVVELPVVEEMGVPEAVPPTEEVHWGEALDILLEEEAAPTPVAEEPAGVSEAEMAEAIEEAIVLPEPPAVEVPAEPEPFAAERAHLKEHARDYEARLALARALWQTGEREEALEAYGRVIRAGKFLESVIPELEEYLEQWPDVGTQRVLGDAYMKDGRLQDALALYRQALKTL
jgi:tetratricopeptide (TPR) repeat protein